MPNAEKMLTVDKIHLSFGGLNALTDVSFEVAPGEIFGLIGPNGSGKTSLLNCINNFYKADSGHIYFDGHGLTRLSSAKIAKIGIARTFQNLALFNSLTVLDNIKVGRNFYTKEGVLSSLVYYGKARREEARQRKMIEEQIIYILKLEDVRDKQVGILPYGTQKLVELARALALEPKLILLDEPTSGMNQEETEDVIRHILDMKRMWNLTILLVEHNLNLVMDICDRICVLDFGEVIATGLPNSVRQDARVIEAYIGTSEEISKNA
jgi:branched-chain amino acid transport system ATP-binding protein